MIRSMSAVGVLTQSSRASVFAFVACLASFAQCQPPSLKVEQATVEISGPLITLRPTQSLEKSELRVPRLFNGIRSIQLVQGDSKTEVACQPEIDHWILKWSDAKVDWSKGMIELQMSHEIHTEPQIQHVQADGSLKLLACDALTQGSKLRYEPQSFKNTIGYWVDKNDFCWWTVELDRPGKFNLEILQGCGKGQGGSNMEVRVRKAKSNEVQEDAMKVPFDVLETGHFQNFQWRHLGELKIDQPGIYVVEVGVVKIAKAAAMDIRELNLVRLPD